ncbi:MAG: type II toxin-antitoxin system PemK/MazF family toxin [Candidatus Obscuribacterales bacterium]|nr:type II toxin-antitoxin system PemK/MazF family toxin [Candidatus Obscuribacterales bacterium]
MSSIHRGDVVLVGFHNAQEKMTIRRPAVIVSVDMIKNEVAVLPMSGRDDAGEKGLRIVAKSPEGKVAGLRIDATIDCRFLGRVPSSLVLSRIGHFDENIMQKLDKLVKG